MRPCRWLRAPVGHEQKPGAYGAPSTFFVFSSGHASAWTESRPQRSHRVAMHLMSALKRSEARRTHIEWALFGLCSNTSKLIGERTGSFDKTL